MIENTIDNITLFFTIFFLSIFLYSLIVSFKEKEFYAAGKLFLVILIIVFTFLFFYYMDLIYKSLIEIILLSLSIAFLILIFIPLKKKYTDIPAEKYNRIDERDTMFSRIRLKEGTENYNNYYSQNPDKKNIDNRLRALPGLLSNDSKYYNSYVFSATDALFYASDNLRRLVDGENFPKHKFNDSIELVKFIKEWAKQFGMHSIGITELKKYHLYSVQGRDNRYNKAVNTNHKYAIAFTCEMSKTMIDTAPGTPTIIDSARQYVNSGIFAVVLAKFLRNYGFSARAHIDGNYQLVCPLVAKDAGLGEIGRMGLLITPKLGPRVRIGVVTTDMELPVDKKLRNQSVLDFCKICKKCANTCPSKAIQYGEPKKVNNIIRWQINSELCHEYWCKAGTDCGRCIAVCPFSHPDNLMHNFVRFGINNNYIFANIALKLDDFLYGKKPKPKPYPKWIKK